MLVRLVCAAAMMGVVCGCTEGESDDRPAQWEKIPEPQQFGQLNSEILEHIEEVIAHLQSDSGDASAWAQLGTVYHAYEVWEAADLCYCESRRLDSGQGRVTYLHALILERLGRDEEADALFARAVELAPGYPPAKWRSVMNKLGSGDLDGAVAVAERGIVDHPGNRMMNIMLARVRLEQDRPSDAAVVLERLHTTDPTNGYVRLLLARALRASGQAERADSVMPTPNESTEPVWVDPWLAEVHALRRGHANDLARANALMDEMDPRSNAQAIAILEDLIVKSPNDGMALTSLGVAYRRAQRDEEAVKVLRRAAEVSPAFDMPHFHLAGVLKARAAESSGDQRLQHAQDGLIHADRVVALKPEGAPGHAMRGDLLMFAGDPEGAMEAYQRAGALDSTSVRWFIAAGEIAIQRGDWQAAMSPLSQADRRDPQNARVLYLLGGAQANAGELDAARATLRRALNVRPGDERIEQALTEVEAAIDAQASGD